MECLDILVIILGWQHLCGLVGVDSMDISLVSVLVLGVAPDVVLSAVEGAGEDNGKPLINLCCEITIHSGKVKCVSKTLCKIYHVYDF